MLVWLLTYNTLMFRVLFCSHEDLLIITDMIWCRLYTKATDKPHNTHLSQKENKIPLFLVFSWKYNSSSRYTSYKKRFRSLFLNFRNPQESRGNFLSDLKYLIGQNFGGQNYRRTKFPAPSRNFGSFVRRNFFIGFLFLPYNSQEKYLLSWDLY